MAKKTNNKEAKPEIIEKPQSIDWSSLPKEVTIIGLGGKHIAKGKEYTIGKEEAQLLVKLGVAKLK